MMNETIQRLAPLEPVLVFGVVLLYALAGWQYLRAIRRSRPEERGRGQVFLLCGLALNLLTILWRFEILQGRGIGVGPHEVVLFLAFTVGLYSWLGTRFARIDSLPVLAAPLAALCALVSLLLVETRGQFPAYLRSGFFYTHVALVFLAYASFLMGSMAAILYLLQERNLKRKQLGPIFENLPSLDQLSRGNFKFLTFGLLLFTVAIGLGLLWSREVFGRYWVPDPKVVTSIVVWWAFAILVALRFFSILRGRWVLVLSVYVVVFMLAAFVGTVLFRPSRPAAYLPRVPGTSSQAPAPETDPL